jgi:hypothetical protein
VGSFQLPLVSLCCITVVMLCPTKRSSKAVRRQLRQHSTSIRNLKASLQHTILIYTKDCLVHHDRAENASSNSVNMSPFFFILPTPVRALYSTPQVIEITHHTCFLSLGRSIVRAPVQMLRDHQARDVGRRQAASA